MPAAGYFAGHFFCGQTRGLDHWIAFALHGITSIGVAAFAGCASLTTLNIPSATSIGALAFGLTGHGDLTVTLGGTAPTLGVSIFSGVTGSTKNVTVKVPSGVSGYGTSPTDTTTSNWGNGFRGGGWEGAAITNSTEINGNVNLVIEGG